MVQHKRLCPSPVNKICIQWGTISSLPSLFYGGLIKDSRINGAELLCPECISMFFGHLSSLETSSLVAFTTTINIQRSS